MKKKCFFKLTVLESQWNLSWLSSNVSPVSFPVSSWQITGVGVHERGIKDIFRKTSSGFDDNPLVRRVKE